MSVILCITGPSCSGKSTLERMLHEQLGYAKFVSTTTRAMREGEVEGEQYYYVDQEEFINRQLDDKFVEVVEFSGNRYGLEKSEVRLRLAENPVCVLVAEPEGSEQVKEFAKEEGIEFIHVYITNEITELMRRWISRFKEDSNADVEFYSKRIVNMLLEELQWGVTYDFDITVMRFDEDNEAEVIDYIAKIVRSNETGIIDHRIMREQPEEIRFG